MNITAKKKIITPTPQFFRQKNGTIQATRFHLLCETKMDDVNLELLKTIVPVGDEADIHTKSLSIVRLQTEAPEIQQSGAYSLRTNSRGIAIGIYDQRSLFYALKTLGQLIDKEDGKVIIPMVEINDFPDVRCRGIVEGFYGIPWSFEDRVGQLGFYGDLKLNTYIYGPKDDPYHSSPNWRDPYPDDKASEIRQLIEVARKNYVDFVWAVHPGKDIRWTDEDRNNLLKKFGWMYDLGVTSFAVFFDDIIGDGTNPHNQAGLLNYLHDRFIQKYPDVKPLIMCPTEYNRSWANPAKGSYLDILGEELHPAIRVLWTGSRVISDIDKDTTEWANRRLKRKIFFWWNFPVNDYARDHLLMGPAYGNTKNINNEISGFVCNPMEKAEASKIGIFGVAAYTWNMRRYDAKKSLRDAVRYIAPEIHDALALFAENNGDPGPNGHGYRRNESERIRPLINKLKTGLVNSADEALLEEVRKYFYKISYTSADIIRNANNRNLVAEIKPWLDQFALLGQAGSAILQALKSYDKRYCEVNWNNYLEVRRILLKIEKIDKTQNQNLYQPGVKTGSLILMPFVRYAYDLLGNKVFGNPLVQRKRKTTRGHIISNIIQLEAQNVQISDESISISPYLEPIVMKSESYIGLRWPENKTATQLHYNFNIKEIAAWGAFEVSPNGNDWVLYNIQLKDQLGDLPLKPYLSFVRFINNSDETHSIYLNEFTVKTKINDARRDISAVKDRNPRTYMTIPAGGHIRLAVKKLSPLHLFFELFQQEIKISNLCNGDIYSGRNNYVLILPDSIGKCEEIKITNCGKNSIHFFEIF